MKHCHISTSESKKKEDQLRFENVTQILLADGPNPITTLENCKNWPKSKFSSSKMVKMAISELLHSPEMDFVKIDFTENLSDKNDSLGTLECNLG